MTLRRLAALQWFGLVGGGLVWAVQLVLGFGVTDASCGTAGATLGVDNDAWQLGLLASAVLIVLAAEAAAAAVFARTRPAQWADDPPPGRLHFLSAAALVANVIFLGIVVLSGVAALVGTDCRSA
jgi:hypothetical protein